jgi:hypothetical protein
VADEFIPTPAEEYPVVKTLDLEMPSGARVRVRRPSFFYLAEHGQIPANVRKLVARRDNTKAKRLTEAELLTILDFALAAAYVSPKVSITRAKGCVYLHDIPDEDRHAVINALDLKAAV